MLTAYRERSMATVISVLLLVPANATVMRAYLLAENVRSIDCFQRSLLPIDKARGICRVMKGIFTLPPVLAHSLLYDRANPNDSEHPEHS